MIDLAPNLTEVAVPKEVLLQIPEAIARQYLIFPFEQENNVLKVAMVNPENQETIELLQAKTGKIVRPYKIDQVTLTKLMQQYSAVLEMVQQMTKQGAQTIGRDSPAIKIVDSLLKQSIKERASDIHIEPNPDETSIRYRVDGVLKLVITLPKETHSAIVSRIKILSNLKIDVTRTPQDGRFQTVADGKSVDLRVSTYPTVDGEKIVMRILDKSKGLLTLKELGVTGRQYTLVESAITKPHGMILVTGPTGSGKTTTLYAMLQQLQKPEVNIITLEDPVEYRMKGINQGQIAPEIGFTFAVGLRSILRQDPDIVMIGEVRDLESAELAVQAALTGHIVLSTLHTNDSVGAIPRLLDIGIPPFLLNASLNLIIAQRLARKLCDNCKKPSKLLPANQKAVENIISSMPEIERQSLTGKTLTFYQAVGCHQCGLSGYTGRIGIFEILDITDNIKPLIIKEADALAIGRKAKEQGMLSLTQDGVIKAAAGLTSLEEVWRITRV